jgi:valine dehydrogenase (NAD+)
MAVFDRASSAARGHEQVTYWYDAATGLRAIVAIYSTARGPALGGTRFHPYETEDAALDDVLNLAKAMAYKAACAGLPLGGGKAVIIGDPHEHKTPELLRAYGRCVEALGGRYYTACDVGTYVEDMDVVAEESRFVTGRSVEKGGAGDSSILTAYGVFQGMRAAAEHRWGEPTVAGRRVGVAGVGKVGRHLVELLHEDGASVVIADVDRDALTQVTQSTPGVSVVAPDALVGEPLDVFAPCALGNALTESTVAELRASIVCGGANNQLAAPGIEHLVADRGILYAPDYVVNAGGLIAVAEEINGYDEGRARAKAGEIYTTTREILALADREGVPPSIAADRFAEVRMAQAAR